MERFSVRSDNIQSIGYDPTHQILEIEFKGGRIYRYSGVPLEKYERLMSSSSKGGYFHSNIKDRYPCSRL